MLLRPVVLLYLAIQQLRVNGGFVMKIDFGNCKLRSWHLEDVGSLVKHANNRKIWVNLRDQFPHPYTQTDGQNWIQTALTVRPETSFAIDVGGMAVGSIGFRLQTDVERFSAEVGYWLGEEFWGRGIGTAALKAATQYAVGAYRLNRIFALPFEGNIASMHVLEKARYRRECQLRKSVYKNGQFMDQLLYAYIVEG
jgi:RimJ/RimL family protein N-acetyltransferase